METPDYLNWIGKRVTKTSIRNKMPKPFKSGKIVNTVKDVTVNPYSGKIAFSFFEDDSVVNCQGCKLIK